MTVAAETGSRRILVIDDNPSIHEDFRKILCPDGAETRALAELEAALFGGTAETRAVPAIALDSAFQGQEGLDHLKRAAAAGRPYDAAFVDVRMPPGWDGIETSRYLWEAQPELEIVICTAYSDHGWEDTLQSLGHSDRLIILKKPFDNIEVLQLAYGLTEKALLRRQAQVTLDQLQRMVDARTQELADVNARLRSEIKEREQIEVELRHAQKLESVGRLASGIAHEVNTPIQFVSDNVFFLRSAGQVLSQALIQTQAMITHARDRKLSADELAALEAMGHQEDLAYLQEEMPRAFEQTAEGLARVTEIVRAMREFAHPDTAEKTDADINRALVTTLAVARHEYRHVADIETSFASLPPVACHLGDLNQVFLNVIVNAAHAIGDRLKATGEEGARGTITIKTSALGDAVLIEIGDTGGGIPDEIQEKIFEPFFTTKEVGRGTGQGLAISRAIVVNKHGGALTFTTEVGRGTTFRIMLPVRKNSLGMAV